MNASRLLLAAALLLMAACAAPSEEEGAAPEAQTEAQALINEAIAAHGMGTLDNAVVEFDFRDAHFTVRRQEGQFRYARAYTDSTGAAVLEVLTNDSLYRTTNGERQDLSESERRGVETAVNSVVYFALLPYFLSDPAVRAQMLPADTIAGQPYRAVEVTFQEEGGGRDWEDRFVYWLHPERRTVDYLAYYYHTDETGTRFREAVGARAVNGVRFQDYLNFTADPDTLGPPGLERFVERKAAGDLKEVSEIRLENVQVRPLGTTDE